MAKIVLRGVTKSFNGKVAVDDLNLEVEDGEFLIIVGPRAAARPPPPDDRRVREAPTMGTLHIGGKLMNDVPPKDRNLAMVFQNYALFPHMTVAQEPLVRDAGPPRAEEGDRLARSHEIAEMLGIGAAAGPQARPALRRRTSAGRPRAGAAAQAAGVPARRAAVQPRRGAAGPDALRAEAHPRAVPGHDRLRDPRPGRGDDDGRPDRADEPGRAAAGRAARDAVQRAGQRLRGGLHRQPRRST